jgi:hypothetical protein
MKSKFLLFLSLSLMLFYTLSAQSKKERIEILNLRVDSLNKVALAYFNDLQLKSNRIDELNGEVTKLKHSIQLLNTQDSVCNESLSLLNRQYGDKLSEIATVNKRFNQYKDSIANLNFKCDTVIWKISDDLMWNQIPFDIKIGVPLNIFNKPLGEELISFDLNTRVKYKYNLTYWSDNENPSQRFLNIGDAVNYYKKGLMDVRSQVLNNSFIIIGKNELNELVYIKGVYDELVSMGGRISGEPLWVFSNTLVLYATTKDTNYLHYKFICNWLGSNFNESSIKFR